MTRGTAAVAVLVLAALLAGCSLTVPTDPEGTLDRVRGGTLRVGVSHHEPWTSWVGDEDEPEGIEVDLVRDFASSIDAEVAWTGGGEESLISALERGDLDLVIGGLTNSSPWSQQAALTAIYNRTRGPDGEELAHVMAAPLGENAFLVELEHFLREHGGR